MLIIIIYKVYFYCLADHTSLFILSFHVPFPPFFLRASRVEVFQELPFPLSSAIADLYLKTSHLYLYI